MDIGYSLFDIGYSVSFCVQPLFGWGLAIGSGALSSLSRARIRAAANPDGGEDVVGTPVLAG